LRSAIWSFVRIDQTYFGRSGGLAPTSLPLFQGPRLSERATEASLSCMVILLVAENGQHGSTQAFRVADWRPLSEQVLSPPSFMLGGRN
jgi:hypothetical protein